MNLLRLGMVVGLLGPLACTAAEPAAETSEGALAPVIPPAVLTAEYPWSGEWILVRNDGAQVSIGGGLEIVADPAATTVKATAEPNGPAELTVQRESGQIVVRCDNAHAAPNGCNKVTVTIPAGTAAKPVTLLAASGGLAPVRFDGRAAVLRELGVFAEGDIDATTAVSVGTNVRLTTRSGGDIRFAVPRTFASDIVRITADHDAIDTRDFPTFETGKGLGVPGTGAAGVSLESYVFAGSTGKVTLAAY